MTNPTGTSKLRGIIRVAVLIASPKHQQTVTRVLTKRLIRAGESFNLKFKSIETQNIMINFYDTEALNGYPTEMLGMKFHEILISNDWQLPDRKKPTRKLLDFLTTRFAEEEGEVPEWLVNSLIGSGLMLSILPKPSPPRSSTSGAASQQ